MEAELYGAEPGMVSLEGRVALSLQLEDAHVHEVDFDDLYVSEYVLKTLHQTAALIVGELAARGDTTAMSEIGLASLKFHAFWTDSDLRLILAAEAGTKLHLIEVPQKHWSVRQTQYH